MSAGNAPHSRYPQRVAERRDHRPVQVTGRNTAGIHPVAETTGHRQHVDDRARGITPPRQPGTVSLDEGVPTLPGFRRRSVMTRLHSRSTVLRQQKPQPAHGTMPTHRLGNLDPEALDQARSRHAARASA